MDNIYNIYYYFSHFPRDADPRRHVSILHTGYRDFTWLRYIASKRHDHAGMIQNRELVFNMNLQYLIWRSATAFFFLIRSFQLNP